MIEKKRRPQLVNLKTTAHTRGRTTCNEHSRQPLAPGLNYLKKKNLTSGMEGRVTVMEKERYKEKGREKEHKI